MRKILLVLALLAQFSYAEEDLKQVYLDFEAAYMSNDVSRFKPLLGKKYKISQTLHTPGGISDTRPVSKKQLLRSMKAMEKPNTMPRSTPESTKIRTIDKGGFCGESSTVNKAIVSGKKHEEKEIRKVCFQKTKKGYLAVSHNIDIYFTEI